jgi:polyisoprenyl-phosphate glycosyltransferase
MNPIQEHCPADTLRKKRESLSIIVPVFNEALVVQQFYSRTSAVLATLDCDYELLFVDDGSTDHSVATLLQIAAQDQRVGLICLSRNFGKEVATSAGLDASVGDAVIVIDADLQHPPELITEFVARWREGYEVVVATRSREDSEGWFKRQSSRLYYRLLNRLSNVDIPVDTGDFRLMSRAVVKAVCSMREHHRYMKGLFAWAGFKSIAIPYSRAHRQGGDSKWGNLKLFALAIEGITSFSIVPLRFATIMGFLVAMGTFTYAVYFVIKTLLFGEVVRGFPTLITLILFISGVQLLCLGVIGEYLGRVYNEAKRRPLYFVARQHDSSLAHDARENKQDA